jgi:hypothetical protein
VLKLGKITNRTSRSTAMGRIYFDDDYCCCTIDIQLAIAQFYCVPLQDDGTRQVPDRVSIFWGYV